MKYIPLVALVLWQTTATGAEGPPAFDAQVNPYNAPPIILAQTLEELDEAEEEAAEEADEEKCEDNTSKAECEATLICTWTDEEVCVFDDE